MKISVALVFPEIGFYKNAQELFNEHHRSYLEPNDGLQIEYDLEERALPSSQLDQIPSMNFDKYDAIISRGLNCELLRKDLPGIPIIDIPASGNDLIYCLQEIKSRYGSQPVAIIGNNSLIMGSERLADIMKMNVKLYYRHSPSDAYEILDKAVSDGYKIIIGGAETYKYALKLGLKAFMIKTEKAALWHAFSEMKKVVHLNLQQLQKAQFLKTVLDYSTEGILQVGEDHKVQVCNQTAQQILDLKCEPVGKYIQELLGKNQLSQLCKDENSYYCEVVTYKEKKLVVNKVPVRVKTSPVSHIISIQNITQVQNTEKIIRKKLKNLGWVAKYTFPDIIGESAVIRSVIKRAKRYAQIDSDILIIGQSGTGKELLAQSIHSASSRSNGPFVAINCAAISETLMESELFGYVGGAFTGAQSGGKIGLFEQANNGTIFLDEIGEVPLNLQSKLLRVIQEREIMRLGDNKIIPINVRIIAATNRDLFQLSRENRFRLDLYYRLDGLRLTLPPINERGHDVGILAEHLLKEQMNKYGSKGVSISLSEDARELLEHIRWHGNIRQLNNLCLRIVCNGCKNEVDANQIRLLLNSEEKECDSITAHPIANQTETKEPNEKLHIRDLLIYHSYNREKTAKELGISRSTLWRKMKQYDLK